MVVKIVGILLITDFIQIKTASKKQIKVYVKQSTQIVNSLLYQSFPKVKRYACAF